VASLTAVAVHLQRTTPEIPVPFTKLVLSQQRAHKNPIYFSLDARGVAGHDRQPGDPVFDDTVVTTDELVRVIDAFREAHVETLARTDPAGELALASTIGDKTYRFQSKLGKEPLIVALRAIQSRITARTRTIVGELVVEGDSVKIVDRTGGSPALIYTIPPSTENDKFRAIFFQAVPEERQVVKARVRVGISCEAEIRYLEGISQPPSAKLIVQREPHSESRSRTTVPKGVPIKILGLTGSYYYVQANGWNGFAVIPHVAVTRPAPPSGSPSPGTPPPAGGRLGGGKGKGIIETLPGTP
jgi:hypothetical protein